MQDPSWQSSQIFLFPFWLLQPNQLEVAPQLTCYFYDMNQEILGASHIHPPNYFTWLTRSSWRAHCMTHKL